MSLLLACISQTAWDYVPGKSQTRQSSHWYETEKTWFANLQLIIKRACQGAKLPQHVFNITSEKVIADFSGKGVPERVQ